MPWPEATVVSLRREFVMLALSAGANVRRLCRRYGISPTTGYKWIKRYQQEGEAGLHNRSRRPHTSPSHTPTWMEEKILAVRDAHPAWGGRKIKARLEALGVLQVPAPSTITEILRRNSRLDPEESRKHRPWKRFEAEAPNDLWQMDFKGHFALSRGGRCHPLTVLDDHSRFALGLRACGDERRETVQSELTAIFHRYGLPERLLIDNGSTWSADGEGRLARLEAWLIHLGIAISHTGKYHPQTLGKDERFHRTLSVEVIRGRIFQDLAHCQRRFDPWREVYNFERPHEALDMAVPASHYRESDLTFPETLSDIEYGPGDIIRKVSEKGIIWFRGRSFRVGKGLYGYPVALRTSNIEGVFKVFFCHHMVSEINLKDEAL